MRVLLALLLVASGITSAQAATCDASLFGDGVCDCGCGTTDPDCPSGTFKICGRTHCAAGKVPWEHQPESCMSSACGDGWNDPAAGETCDDGNAVASGGCSADCKTVSVGFTCGDQANGCQAASGSPDAGTAVDAGMPDANSPAGMDAGTGAGGCASLPGAPLALAALAWLLRRRTA